MGKKKSADYQVGYGKPPTATRFKKGESGNPKGRPKGSKNLASVLQAALDSKITVRDGDTVKTMTGLEAMVHSLTIKAIQGDIRSVQAVVKLIQGAELRAATNQATAPPARSGVLVVPPVLTEKAWETIYSGDGLIERATVREVFNEMLEVGQMVKGLIPFPKPDDSG